MNCDEYTPEAFPAINPLWTYSETEGVDKTFTVPVMSIATSTGHTDICPVTLYAFGAIQTGITMGSLTPCDPATFVPFHFEFNPAVAVRSVKTKWSGFNGGGGFSVKEGIYLINAKACTTSTQPGADCRHF